MILAHRGGEGSSLTEWQKVVHIEGVVTIQKQFIIGSCLVLVLAAVVQDLAVRYELLIPAPVSCIILIIWQILTLIIHFTNYYTSEYIELKIYPHWYCDAQFSFFLPIISYLRSWNWIYLTSSRAKREHKHPRLLCDLKGGAKPNLVNTKKKGRRYLPQWLNFPKICHP